MDKQIYEQLKNEIEKAEKKLKILIRMENYLDELNFITAKLTMLSRN